MIPLHLAKIIERDISKSGCSVGRRSSSRDFWLNKTLVGIEPPDGELGFVALFQYHGSYLYFSPMFAEFGDVDISFADPEFSSKVTTWCTKALEYWRIEQRKLDQKVKEQRTALSIAQAASRLSSSI